LVINQLLRKQQQKQYKQTAKALKGGGKGVDLFHYRWDKRGGGEKEE
jgi:hypothetical protein